MRNLFLIIAAAIPAACGHAGSPDVTLEVGKVERLNGCHVFLHHVIAQESPYADMTYVCDVPESALKEKNWWGEQAEPPATTMHVGDCIRLDKTFYCMEKLEPGARAILQATYKQFHPNGDFLEVIR